MVNFVTFNELSLPYQSGDDIDLGFINLFKLIRGLRDKGINKVRTEQPTKYWEITSNTFFPQYLNQLKNRELKVRLQTFLNNNEVVELESPLVAENEESDELLNPTYQYNNKVYFGGLACANYWDALAISFNSKADWNKSRINLYKDSIKIEVRHASKTEHLNEHIDYFDCLEKERKLAITQRNFWEIKGQYFTNFEFLGKIEGEIKKLDAHVFKQFVSVLRSIETGRKALAELNVSGESLSTNNNPRYVELRTFVYQGNKCYFEKHIKNFHSGYRMHFLEKDSKIIIGYVGPHLPTSSSN